MSDKEIISSLIEDHGRIRRDFNDIYAENAELKEQLAEKGKTIHRLQQVILSREADNE